MADTRLIVSLQKASQLIEQRIKQGRRISERQAPKTMDQQFLLVWWDAWKVWDDYNNTMLRKLFNDESVADQYEASTTFRDTISSSDLRKDIVAAYRVKMRELASIKARLALYKSTPPLTSITSSPVKYLGNKVFIVHGHDEAIKESVARFLEKLDLKVVILHEKPDKGKTVIEKLEANSSEVDIGYAVVLLTPDDMGAALSEIDESSSKQSLQYRARQNVVFELGYFIAKLGRERVCAMYVEGVELPGDYKGVLYKKLGDTDSWKLPLAQEIKAAGIKLDLNKIA